MPLTQSQKTLLKAYIVSVPALNNQPLNSDGASVIADAINLPAAQDFFVYRTNIPPQDIYDQIQWAKMTPTDAPDGTQTWANRSLSCQGKQFNLQTMLMGQAVINGAKSNVRAGLQDALTNVPSGASGAPQAANWVGVRDNALARKASGFEKVLASGGDGAAAATAATMGVEGPVNYQDVEDARNHG